MMERLADIDTEVKGDVYVANWRGSPGWLNRPT